MNVNLVYKDGNNIIFLENGSLEMLDSYIYSSFDDEVEMYQKYQNKIGSMSPTGEFLIQYDFDDMSIDFDSNFMEVYTSLRGNVLIDKENHNYFIKPLTRNAGIGPTEKDILQYQIGKLYTCDDTLNNLYSKLEEILPMPLKIRMQSLISKEEYEKHLWEILHKKDGEKFNYSDEVYTMKEEIIRELVSITKMDKDYFVSRLFLDEMLSMNNPTLEEKKTK